MSHFQVKTEPDSESKENFGLFVDDDVGPPFVGGNSSKNAPEALLPEPEWRRCEEVDRFKRVQIKEFAVSNAYSALIKIRETLRFHLTSNASCQPRIDKIHAILGRKKEFKVLVGFLGTTGVGKTTLLNALIGAYDLLPCSDWRASTSVPVEVSYNKKGDMESLYRAEIVYITTTEWEQELQLLFEDLQAVASGEVGDDDEDDSERAERIEQAIHKIKYVYPHINTRQKLVSTSVEELMSHLDISAVLSSTKTIAQSTKKKFALAIRHYIDSGDEDGKISAHWPLVKLVRVYVKADILKSGIVLVDMPGSLDSNLARSKVAANYQKELSVSCVVENITRGISEKNAKDLLEKIAKRNLQLDGLYNSDSLCFVLSQTDKEFNYKNYIKQTPVLNESTVEDSKEIRRLMGDIGALKRQRDNTKKKYNEKKKLAKKLSKETVDIKSRLDALSNSAGNLSHNRKRTANETEAESEANIATSEQIELRKKASEMEKRYSELQGTIRKDGEMLLSLDRRLKNIGKALFYAESRLRVAAIQHRNQLSTAAIRKDYEMTLQEMGRQSTKPLQVFPVSAEVHLNYLALAHQPGRIHPGFPNRSDTNVPALRDWLLGTTLDTRERYAQAFLEDVEQFVRSMQPWINDKYRDMKMSAEVRESWEPQFENQIMELKQNLNDLDIETSNEMRQLVTTNIYSMAPEAERMAAKQAKGTAEKWAAGCHWSTHRCVNRVRGLWEDSKGKVHKWNDDLVHDLTNHLVNPWDRTFFREFPNQQASYVEKGISIITEFASLATDNDPCPDVSDGLEVLKDHIIQTENLLKSQIESVFEEVTKAVRKAHKEAVPAVKSFLEPMYSTCAAEGGRGHYARNKATHRQKMQSEGRAMHHEATRAIKSAVDKLLNSLPSKFANAYNPVLEQIREEIKRFFEQNTSDGKRNTTRRVISTAKIRLHKDLSVDLNALANDWDSRLPVESSPQDDESDDEMNFGNFVEVDNSRDDDYQDDSD